jgi:PAS domain S-box-containing protein
MSEDGAERKRLAAARFEALFENSHALIVIRSRDGRYLAANPRFRAVMGLNRLEGRSIYDILPAELADALLARERRVFETGERLVEEETIPNASGRPIRFLASKFLIPEFETGDEALCVVLTDIDAQHRREEENARSKARFETVLENAPAEIFLKDRAGVFLFANPMFEAAFRAELRGETGDRIVTPESLARLEALDRAVFDTRESWRGEDVVDRIDGERLHTLAARFLVPDPSTGEDVLCRIGVDITELRRREAEVGRLRARMQAIFDNTEALVFLKRRDGTFITANRSFCETVGFEDVAGLTNADLMPEGIAALLEAQDARIFETERPERFQDRVTLASGETRDFIASKFLIPDEVTGDLALCGIATDVTALRAQEARTAALKARFETLIENADAAVFLKARDGRILLANRRYLATAGREDVIGRTPFELWPAEVARALCAQDDKVFESGEPFLGVERLVTPDAAEAFYKTSKFLMHDPETGEDVLCGIATDITEQIRLQASLEESRRAAEAATEAKSRFLATMSHEIRTPMNGVLAMAALLEARLSGAEERRMLGVIRDSGAALMTILNDILDFSKMEAGRIDLEAAPFSLDEAVRRVAAVHALKAEDKGLDFGVRIGPGAVGPRLGDSHRVQQILHNLVGNAIKFTEGGAVAIDVDGDATGVEITVRDTGPGMTPEQARRVFEEFSQADNSTTRRFGGTGLGLAIVKGLVGAMGGTVTLETAPGAGAVFRVALPLPCAAALVETAATDATAPPPGLRVLAADDNEVNRMVLETFLRMLGAEVTMVAGGREAVAASETRRFDALLLDISMPDMDGVAALGEIRRRERALGAAPAPAVAVTANAMAHQIETYRAAGFDAHLAKPLHKDELSATLARVARASRAPAPA